MAANPALTHSSDGHLAPAPFQGEVIALRRAGVDFYVEGVRTRTGSWSSSGAIYLTNLRLVFVADKPDAASGLTAFDVPVGYIHKEVFKQPVFQANNLRGQVWAASPAGGPDRQQPPHSWIVYFKNGGVGTCIPFFLQLMESMRASQQQAQQGHSAPSASVIQAHLPTAFVDPSDPTSLFLASPVSEADRLPTAPTYYAADYDRTSNEQYQSTGLQPGSTRLPAPAAV